MLKFFYHYTVALIGATLAMAGVLFVALTSRADLLSPTNVNRAISTGLVFGHIVAFAVVIGSTIPRQFERLLPRILCAFSAVAISIGAWAYYHIFVLLADPDWFAISVGGTVLASGFMISGFIATRKSQFIGIMIGHGILLFATLLYFHLQWQNSLNTAEIQTALLYFEPFQPQRTTILATWFAGLIVVSGYVPMLFLQESSD